MAGLFKIDVARLVGGLDRVLGERTNGGPTRRPCVSEKAQKRKEAAAAANAEKVKPQVGPKKYPGMGKYSVNIRERVVALDNNSFSVIISPPKDNAAGIPRTSARKTKGPKRGADKMEHPTGADGKRHRTLSRRAHESYQMEEILADLSDFEDEEDEKKKRRPRRKESKVTKAIETKRGNSKQRLEETTQEAKSKEPSLTDCQTTYVQLPGGEVVDGEQQGSSNSMVPKFVRVSVIAYGGTEGTSPLSVRLQEEKTCKESVGDEENGEEQDVVYLESVNIGNEEILADVCQEPSISTPPMKRDNALLCKCNRLVEYVMCTVCGYYDDSGAKKHVLCPAHPQVKTGLDECPFCGIMCEISLDEA